MEESQKKVVMVIVVIVCLAAAGAVFYKTHFTTKLKSHESTLLKCAACGNTEEIPMNEFTQKWDQVREKFGPTAPPVFKCPKCGKTAVRPAKKCPKCGEIFIEGNNPEDFSDRCPKCKYSPSEEMSRH